MNRVESLDKKLALPHSTPFWKLVLSDGVSFGTFLLLASAIFLQSLAILGVVWSRVHFGCSFDPIVFSAFEEKKSDASVSRALGLQEAKALQNISVISENDPASLAMDKADQEIDQARIRQAELDFVKKESDKKAEQALRQAEISLKNHSPELAISQLQAALQYAPEYLPVIKKLAFCLELQHAFESARFQWEKASGLLPPQSTELAEVQQNIARLAKLANESRTAVETAPITTLRVTSPSYLSDNSADSIRVIQITRNDLPLEDLYDLRFNLRITLSSHGKGPSIDLNQVKVEVSFYDAITSANGSLDPKKILSTNIQPKQLWSIGTEQVLLVNYSVPRGFFRKQAKKFGSSYGFCGYQVRAFYRGQLQNSFSEPVHVIPP